MMDPLASTGISAEQQWDSTRPWAASACSTGGDWEQVLDRTVLQVMPSGCSAPDVLMLFASTAFTGEYERILHRARMATGATTTVGCSVNGFSANGCEFEGQPGLALMTLWLPGASLAGVHLAGSDPVALGMKQPGQQREIRSWFILAEPYRVDALGLIHRLKDAFPGRTIFGGMASGLDRDRTGCLFLNGAVHRQGAVALGIGGDYEVSVSVSQGCFPIGEPLTITDVDRSALLAISNKPAVGVLQEALANLSPSQRERAPNNVTVGLAVDEYLDSYASGDFFVRGILGIDARRGAVVVGGLPRVGQTVQFHLREASRAGDDLVQAMTALYPMSEHPVAAIACICEGRGSTLFGHPDHDAGLIAAGLPGVPMVGAFCPGEIGPLGKTTVIHGFTATTGIIRPYVPSEALGRSAIARSSCV